MKNVLGTTLAALMLAVPVVATAATVGNAARRQPQVITANMAASFPYSESHPYAVLDNQDSIHLMPVSPVAHNAIVTDDAALGLMNRTGGER